SQCALSEGVDLEIIGHAVEVKADRSSGVFEAKSDDWTIYKDSSTSLESPSEKPAETKQ
ncbi:hypothetical protein BGZ97_008593, partial [Linnemannia gamsii]